MFSDVDLAIIIIVLADAIIIYFVNKGLTVPMVRSKILSFFLGKTEEDRHDLAMSVNAIFSALEPRIDQKGAQFFSKLKQETEVTINNYMTNHMAHYKDEITKEIQDLKRMAGSVMGNKSAGKREELNQAREAAAQFLTPIQMAMAKGAGKIGRSIGMTAADAEMMALAQFMKPIIEKEQKGSKVAALRKQIEDTPGAKEELLAKQPEVYKQLFPEETINTPEINSEDNSIKEAKPNGTPEEVPILQGDAPKARSVQSVQEATQD